VITEIPLHDFRMFSSLSPYYKDAQHFIFEAQAKVKL
jgi:hypothetical protein